jgi:hypothetical protein
MDVGDDAGWWLVKMPVDPATGKPMVPAITDSDTDEAKNAYLLTLGVDQQKAMDLVYNAKNANRDLAQAGIFKSIVDGMSTMKTSARMFRFRPEESGDHHRQHLRPADANGTGRTGIARGNVVATRRRSRSCPLRSRS